MGSRDGRFWRAALVVRRLLWNIRYHPGSYYSPIPSSREIRYHRDRIFTPRRKLPGIDIREREQMCLVHTFASFYPEFPFTAERVPRYRYFSDNPFFGIGDAVMLYSALRYFKPPHVIEVGSGFSSSLMLDVNEHFLAGSTTFTFIDPHPVRLDKLLRGSDEQTSIIVRRPVQDVDPRIFGELQSGDLLFIDSSHVSKVGSDVNLLLLDVVPKLAKGVIIHIHDVFHSFEYPEKWFQEGRAWNEDYLLRALLTSNSTLEILIFNSYLGAFHRDEVQRLLPAWGNDSGGSIWLRRI
jgi:hypothetical protein